MKRKLISVHIEKTLAYVDRALGHLDRESVYIGDESYFMLKSDRVARRVDDLKRQKLELEMLKLKEKFYWLANASVGDLPEKPSAIVIFGSPQVEVPQKVVELIKENPSYRNVPIIISGKGKGVRAESEKFRDIIVTALRNSDYSGEIYLDRLATSTDENARNVKSILVSNHISEDDLVYVNFPVLSRSGQNALSNVGIKDVHTVVAGISLKKGQSYEGALSDIKGWIDFHHDKAISYEKYLNVAFPHIKGIGNSYHIKNGIYDVIVDSHGAKVLAVMKNGENILYYDPKDIAHSGIPLCFPSFGPLTDGKLVVDGVKYDMGQHGFIRDCDFNLEVESDSSILCTIRSSEKTLLTYPFEFEFQVKYTVTEDGLNIAVRMKNEGTEAMPISPGIHPYFSVNEPENVYVMTKALEGNNNLEGYEKESIVQPGVLDIMEHYGDGSRLLSVGSAPDMHLIDHRLDRTLVVADKHDIELIADNEVFDRMTIWRKSADSKFICVEPANEQNRINDNPILVEPRETFSTEVVIRVR